MIKKLTLLAMAIAALAALAVPASAAAAPKLTMPAGTLVPAGTTITGTSNPEILPHHLVTTTALGALTCKEVMLNGEVTTNNGSEVKGIGLAGSTATECKFGNGNNAKVTEINLESLQSTVSGVGTAKFSYVADVEIVKNSTISCEFETVVPGAFTYENGGHVITISEAEPVILESELCGESEIHGEVTLETTPSSGGGAVIFDY